MSDKRRPTHPPVPRPERAPDDAGRVGSDREARDADVSERSLRAEGADERHRAQPGRRRRRRGNGRRGDAHANGGTPGAVDRHHAPATTAPRSDSAEPRTTPDLAARIRDLEERLDSMIVAHERARASQPPPRPSQPAPRPSQPPISRHELPVAGRAETLSIPPPSQTLLHGPSRGTARELFSTDFYLRQWGRLGLRNRSEEVDEFGYDPVYEQRVLPLLQFLYEKYFRVEVHGVEHVPSEGRCLLVANHSGVVPVDGIMLRLAVRREHPRRRDARWLAEDAIFHLPFLGSFINRLGAVRACQENAERLLAHGELVTVFPEGMKGIGKLFRDRYKLQRFGRGGFVKLSLRTGTPVVPVAIVGSEETNPMLARVEYLSRVLGLPYLPVTPTFPLLGPLGLLPAPTKWKVYFGEKIEFDRYGPESTDDEILVGRLAEQVRAEIQSMLDRALATRRSVWFG